MRVPGFLLWMASAGSVLATDVWYGDAEAKSANGRYLATAKSPENRRWHPRPFASKLALVDPMLQPQWREAERREEAYATCC